MSGTGDDGKPPEQLALGRLDAAVSRVLEHVEELRSRAEDAEARSAELAEIVRRFTGDAAEADRLLSRLETLEIENTDLRSRVERGRDGVERLLARVRFLEERR